ncbi:hypothetical protein T492DRAFT_1002239 [Pavlovales sp. CCMP2436]|nr:hypothetical protein T492DRAFT_1002239 [Pavlovales sp. CCMP2436]
MLLQLVCALSVALARPSALLGRATARLAMPAAPRAALRLAAAAELDEDDMITDGDEEPSAFEAAVIANAKVVDKWAGEGAWVLVTREADGDDGDGDIDFEVESPEAKGVIVDDDSEDDEEEGVILVQDPTDDKFLLTLFSSEETATKYLYMLLDEDIDSEASYAAVFYTADDIGELLDDDIKIATI